jgi:hypothetical protein
MVITLIRDKFTPAETLGKMLIDRVPFCGTLEPPTVPNATHPKGCIPVGWYKLQVTMSPKFGKELPLICNVPNRSGIRIHGGTLPQHSKGCILIPSCVERKYAIRHFHCEQARKEDIRLEIIDFKPGDPAPPLAPDLTKPSSLKNL